MCRRVVPTRGPSVPRRKKTPGRGRIPCPRSLPRCRPNRVVRFYRMSLEQYESLIASGFFTKRDRRPAHQRIRGEPNGRIALLHAAVERSDRHRGDPAGRVHTRLTEWAEDTRPDLASCAPDLAVVRGDSWDYQARYPEPADTGLPSPRCRISSLDEDRAMAEIYAARRRPHLLDRQRGRRPGRGLLATRAHPAIGRTRCSRPAMCCRSSSTASSSARSRWPTSCPEGIDHANANPQAAGAEKGLATIAARYASRLCQADRLVAADGFRSVVVHPESVLNRWPISPAISTVGGVCDPRSPASLRPATGEAEAHNTLYVGSPRRSRRRSGRPGPRAARGHEPPHFRRRGRWGWPSRRSARRAMRRRRCR